MSLLKKILVAEDGATAVEYAVMLALLILVCITTLGAIGVGLGNIYHLINATVP
jgi:pilus assembly protein Flp/PilA